eukprot:COSAG04_NODE_56_length_30604_cov_692.571119_19_plen_103_part_00
MAEEIKECTISYIALAARDNNNTHKVSTGWRIAFGFVIWFRRWVFLPILVATVPALVLLNGGDALNICLNTVGTLFLAEIDKATLQTDQLLACQQLRRVQRL